MGLALKGLTKHIETFHVLAWFPSITNEPELDYYHHRVIVLRLRKLRNIKKIPKMRGIKRKCPGGHPK